MDVSALPTLREGEEFTDAEGRPAEATASSRPQAEQLEHWQVGASALGDAADRAVLCAVNARALPCRRSRRGGVHG